MARAGRTERGRATRARIVDAATLLFGERGYLETTMAAIAEAAGVSVQTLYLAFGSKVGIVAAAHDVAVAGDDRPVPLLERPWVVGLRSEPEAGRALKSIIEAGLEIIERVHPIHNVLQTGAADQEVAALFAVKKRERYETMRVLAALLAEKTGFVAGESVDWAADVLYTVISDELYTLLVVDCGWSADRWRAFASEMAAARLLATRSTAPRRDRPATSARPRSRR